MSLIIYVIMAVVSLALISSLSVFLHSSPMEMNPILIIVVYLTAHEKLLRSLVYSLVLGGVLDVLSGYTLGMNMLVCGLVSFIAHFLLKAGMSDRGFSMFILVFPLSLIYHFLLLLLLRSLLEYGDLWTLSSILWLALFNASLAFVVRPFLQRFMLSLGFVLKEQDLRERLSNKISILNSKRS